MAVVLNTQQFSLDSGAFATYSVPTWANAAHNVQLFIDLLPPDTLKSYRVPLFYCTEIITSTVTGIAFQFERQSKLIIGAGVSFVPFRPTSELVSYLLYRRDNKEAGARVIRCRLVNFSI